MIKELILNKQYSYRDLEEWFGNEKDKDPNMTWDEIEVDNSFGNSFIVVNGPGIVYSFILYGYNNSKGSMFKLIFME